MSATIVTPGKKLGNVQEYNVGPGTYIRNNYIYSSTLGEIYITNDPEKKVKFSKLKEFIWNFGFKK